MNVHHGPLVTLVAFDSSDTDDANAGGDVDSSFGDVNS